MVPYLVLAANVLLQVVDAVLWQLPLEIDHLYVVFRVFSTLMQHFLEIGNRLVDDGGKLTLVPAVQQHLYGLVFNKAEEFLHYVDERRAQYAHTVDGGQMPDVLPAEPQQQCPQFALRHRHSLGVGHCYDTLFVRQLRVARNGDEYALHVHQETALFRFLPVFGVHIVVGIRLCTTSVVVRKREHSLGAKPLLATELSPEYTVYLAGKTVTQQVSVNKDAGQLQVGHFQTAVCHYGAQVVHIVGRHLHHFGTQVGVDETYVQVWLRVVPQFRHTQYAPHRLGGEGHILHFAENEQHVRPRAVPTQGNGLLEEQYLAEAVFLLQAFQILLLVTQPHGQAAVVGRDVAFCPQIGFHLGFQGPFFRVQALLGVVGQLDEQERIHRAAFPAVQLGQLVSTLQRLLQQALVHGQAAFYVVFNGRIEADRLFDHLFGYHVAPLYDDYIVERAFRCGRNAHLQRRVNQPQRIVALVFIVRSEVVLLVYHRYNGQVVAGARLVHQLSQSAVGLVVAYQDGVVFVDALPVEEQHIVGFQSLAGVHVVPHHGVQAAALGKVVEHRLEALQVQHVGRQPDEGKLPVG